MQQQLYQTLPSTNASPTKRPPLPSSPLHAVMRAVAFFMMAGAMVAMYFLTALQYDNAKVRRRRRRTHKRQRTGRHASSTHNARAKRGKARCTCGFRALQYTPPWSMVYLMRQPCPFCGRPCEYLWA